LVNYVKKTVWLFCKHKIYDKDKVKLQNALSFEGTIGKAGPANYHLQPISKADGLSIGYE